MAGLIAGALHLARHKRRLTSIVLVFTVATKSNRNVYSYSIDSYPFKKKDRVKKYLIELETWSEIKKK